AVEDAVFDHRLSAHAQDEMLSLAEQRRGHLDRLLMREGLDRAPGGDLPEQRHAPRDRILLGSDPAAPIPLARESPLLLEPLQVLLDGAEGRELECLPDLPLRRRDPVLDAVRPNEIEDFLLAFREIHFSPNKIRKKL